MTTEADPERLEFIKAMAAKARNTAACAHADTYARQHARTRACMHMRAGQGWIAAENVLGVCRQTGADGKRDMEGAAERRPLPTP